ncbi:MAG: hypothetical protein ACOCUI_00500 [bacterium]
MTEIEYVDIKPFKLHNVKFFNIKRYKTEDCDVMRMMYRPEGKFIYFFDIKKNGKVKKFRKKGISADNIEQFKKKLEETFYF